MLLAGVGADQPADAVLAVQRDVKHVIVDLGQIPYFGSTVLEWMVQMWKRAKAKGGKLATCQASPIGREVLAAARFDLLWGIFGTREEALAWLSATEDS